MWLCRIATYHESNTNKKLGLLATKKGGGRKQVRMRRCGRVAAAEFNGTACTEANGNLLGAQMKVGFRVIISRWRGMLMNACWQRITLGYQQDEF
jgi:hypothetical protein